MAEINDGELRETLAFILESQKAALMVVSQASTATSALLSAVCDLTPQIRETYERYQAEAEKTSPVAASIAQQADLLREAVEALRATD